MDCKEREAQSRGQQGPRRWHWPRRGQKSSLLCQPLVAAGLSRGDIFLTWGRKGQGAGVCQRLSIYLVGWAVMGDLGTF